MSNKKALLALLCFNLFFLQYGFTQSTQFFSFTLTDSATTSAGVFKSDSTLVRTLWSNVKYSGGSYVKKWEGLLDNGATAPSGNYHVEVVSNKVKYAWDGARIGNTSTDFSGDRVLGSTIHRASSGALGITVSGNYLYYATGYHERFMSNYRTNLNQLGKRIRVGGGNNAAPVVVCSDDSTVYWGTYQESVGTGSYIFATKVSDNSLVSFANGVAVNDVANVIAPKYINDAFHSTIWNIAVQRHGNKLFLSRYDTITVYNKTTGALLQTIAKLGISRLATDTSGNLWIGNGSSVIKYTVNTDGTLTTTGISVTGIQSVCAMAVSPNNNLLLVGDEALTQQVVKGYNNLSGGSALWTLGTPGGYMTDATITDYKFYFNDLRTNYLTALAFQNDGSFWVIDAGNGRMQHYSSNRTYINRIMYIGTAYVVHTDINDSSRLFCALGGGDLTGGYLEFKIDYTKMLDSGMNGSWTLVKNWGGNIGPEYVPFSKIKNIITLSGHTYGRMTNGTGGLHDILELVAGGVTRKTKVAFDVRQGIDKNGDKYWYPSGNDIGNRTTIYKYAYTGLDSDNDPTWSSTGVAAYTTPVLKVNSPLNIAEFSVQKTSSNKFIFFNPERNADGNGRDAHIAAINFGDSAYKFLASYGTSQDRYKGDFPIGGQFDNGNGVLYAGGFSTANGRNIMWTYHGEFWKDLQTNMFNHYRDNGLMIGQFGTLRTDFGDAESMPGGAGNALFGSWVQYNADTAYVYTGDEGVNAGVQRWSITGLNTVNNQFCNFNASLTVPPADYTDLMSDLTTKGYVTNKGRWSISYPGIIFDSSGYFWEARVGNRTPEQLGNQDVYAYYMQSSNSRNIQCALGNNSGLNNWKINGKISFAGNSGNSTSNTGGCYLQVLDNTGKVIANFYQFNSSTFDIKGNDKTINSYYVYNVHLIPKSQDFEISNAGGTLTFKYAGYSATTLVLGEVGANIQAPTTIRMLFTPGSQAKGLGVSELKFRGASNYYRTKASGAWNDPNTWQLSADSSNWNAATTTPSSSDNSITILKGHTVIINGSVTVDQVYIKDSGLLKIAPNASITINDGIGNDVNIALLGSMVIQSDSTGTGRIGNSVGTISGNVTVERFISSSASRTYRLLSPSVNTLNSPKPYIRDNWQEGQNNTNIKTNSNLVPRYGIQITGSTTSVNGFDITSKGSPSLFTYNPANTDPSWIQAGNTNATNLEAKKGYLVIVFGDRSTDLRTNNPSSSTTLRATGTVATGTQIFTKPAGDRGTILVGNPYPSSIDWKTIYNDNSTSNSTNLENYYTYWDDQVGTSGGYVTVNSDGIKSAPTNATTEIQSGQAFLIRPKKGVVAPALMVKESHKSSNNNLNVFRVKQPQEFMTSLYYSKEGRRIMADAVNAVFDNTFSGSVDDNDAEEIENVEENMAIKRDGKMLSIEERPVVNNSDTLPLILQRLKPQTYELQFNPSAFTNPGIHAFLNDQFLHKLTAISLNEITTVKFSVIGNDASASQDRFKIIFSSANELADRIRIAEVTNNQDGCIKISPNPVTSNYATVQFSNLPKGTYLMSLTDNLGQLILTKTIIHAGGTANQTIPIDANLHSGIYTLLITGNGKSFNKKLIK